MKSLISKERFQKYQAKGFNRIPIVLEGEIKKNTPLSIYQKLANESYSYLLESVEGGERSGRYSIIGLPSKLRIQIKNYNILIFEGKDQKKEINDQNPLDFIESFMESFKIPDDLDLPRFSGGLAGYFGYETIQYIEPKLTKEFLEDKLDLPDILLMLSEEVVVIDNLTKQFSIVKYIEPTASDSYERGIERLNNLINKLQEDLEKYFL